MKYLRYHQINTIKLYRISIYLTFGGGRGERFEGYAVTQLHCVIRFCIPSRSYTVTQFHLPFKKQLHCWKRASASLSCRTWP